MLEPDQELGKYSIVGPLGEGGFAMVYQAYDTIEGIQVALKIPHAALLDTETLDDFRNEVHLTARLDHPNILSIKNASFIDGKFVIVYPLGESTLGDRLRRRRSLATSLDYTGQMLDALAYAHRMRVIHCDVKPENFILFSGNRLRLADFGIAKVAQRTIRASGSGTIGYVAPEQAMGNPSFRSDVFSLGLVLTQIYSGSLPEYPFEWPPPNFDRMRRKIHPELIDLIRRSIELAPRKRFENAGTMASAFRRLRKKALVYSPTERRRRRKRNEAENESKRDWRNVRRTQFLRKYRSILATRHRCDRCEGPIAESMRTCPWCGVDRRIHRGESDFPARCRRCQRGMKLDWRYCPWCYGKGYEPESAREYTDIRYSARCSGSGCSRRLLMPFMRYCPWCRRKLERKWKVEGLRDRCSRCGWAVVKEFWHHCPWCAKALP